MAVRAPAERPAVPALGFGDRHVVDARVAHAHEPVLVELPVLVAAGAEPRAAVVVPLVREPDGDAVAGKGPDLLDEAVVELARPLALQEGDDLGAPGDEFRAIAPAAVFGVREGDPLRLAGIPGVFRPADFLSRRLGGKG